MDVTYLIDRLYKTERRRGRLVVNESTIKSRDIQYCRISETRSIKKTNF
jgi:hypothetical protein